MNNFNDISHIENYLLGRMPDAERKAFEAELLAEGEPIDPAALIGQNVTVALDLENGEGRRFLNGMVCRLAQGGADERFIAYRATIVPFVWLLSQRRDCRIFQNVSVTGIAEKVRNVSRSL